MPERTLPPELVHELFALVWIDDQGEERCLSFNLLQGLTTAVAPAVATELTRSVHRLAQLMAEERRTTVRIVRFRRAEVVEEIRP